jgi:hypothetical protein
MMNAVSDKIRKTVQSAKSKLLMITSDKVSVKVSPASWSKKEILGHLIDSASFNHQRFVRAAQDLAKDFPLYDQNKYVEVQRYNESDWNSLVELFYQYNMHLAYVIEGLKEDVMDNLCSTGKGVPAALSSVIEDYLWHLNHHIDKILEQ